MTAQLSTAQPIHRRASRGEIFHEIQEFGQAALSNADLNLVLGYLGFSLVQEGGEYTLTYQQTEEVARRTDALNRALQPIGESIIRVQPYDGGELPLKDYFQYLSQDTLPVTTGRAGSVWRGLFGLIAEPYRGVREHDWLVHYVPQLSTAPEYRRERGEFLADALERPEERVPYNSSGATRPRIEMAWEVVENGLQLPAIGNKITDGRGVQGTVADGVLSIRRAMQPDSRAVLSSDDYMTQRQQIIQRTQQFMANVAGVVRTSFRDIQPAVAALS